MKQRVALARTLAVDPGILLMDEPFGALDALTRRQLQQELASLWTRTGKTIVFVTHDVQEAVYLGQRVIVMGARPGTIRTEFDSRLGGVQGPQKLRSPDFADLTERAWAAVVAQMEGVAGP
jgi:ABC-type nitrate/sulfonate/bicarbonate transport system ATPase subunit